MSKIRKYKKADQEERSNRSEEEEESSGSDDESTGSKSSNENRPLQQQEENTERRRRSIVYQEKGTSLTKEINLKTPTAVVAAGPRSVGVRSRIAIDNIVDINHEVHLILELVFHYECPEAKEGPGLADFVTVENEKQIYKPVYEFLFVRRSKTIKSKFFMRRGTHTVYHILEMRLEIREVLELQKFPFDQQVVKIQLQSFFSRFTKWHALHLLPRIQNHPFWKHHDHIVSFDESTWQIADVRSEVVNDDVGGKSFFTVSAVMNRNGSFYVFNFILVVFIVVEVSTFIIAVDPFDFGARAGLAFTLLLTLVAFKFTMSSFIPKVSYQTWLDKYLLLSFILLGSNIVENFIVSGLFFNSKSLAKRIDVIYVIITNVIWIGLHLVIGVGTRLDAFFKTPAQVLKDDDAIFQYDAEDDIEKSGDHGKDNRYLGGPHWRGTSNISPAAKADGVIIEL
jgi:hypothetical protein